MADNYTTDAARLAALRSNKADQHEQIFIELQNKNNLLNKADGDGFVSAAAFGSLLKLMQSANFRQKEPLQAVFDTIVRNIASAEPIRTGSEKACNQLLKEIYTEGTAYNMVRQMLVGHPQLQVEAILNESLDLLYDAVVVGKYGGRSTLKTFFVSICKNRVLEALREGKQKTTKDGQTTYSSKVILEGDFVDVADESGADINIVIEEQNAAEALRDKILREVLNSASISTKCLEALTLQYYKDFSMAAIAAFFGTTKQTAKNEAARCREQLRKVILENTQLTNFFTE